jgi:hypothetical protein
MTYPRSFFARSAVREEPGHCFVIMPFAPEYRIVYDSIAEAVENEEVGFSCTRADEIYNAHIIDNILREMARASIVVADLSGRNPNVFYELGIAHMSKDEDRIVLLAQNMDDVPFDLREYRCIPYSLDEAGLRRLRREITDTVRGIAGSAYRIRLARGGRCETPAQFPGHDRYLYSIALSDAMIGMDFIECRLLVRRHGIGEDAEVVEDRARGLARGESIPIEGTCWWLRLDAVGADGAMLTVAREVPNSCVTA